MAVAANGNGKAPVSRFIRNLETDRTRYAYTGYLKGFFFFLKNGTVRQPPSSNGPDLIADLDAQAVPYLAEIRSGSGPQPTTSKTSSRPRNGNATRPTP